MGFVGLTKVETTNSISNIGDNLTVISKWKSKIVATKNHDLSKQYSHLQSIFVLNWKNSTYICARVCWKSFLMLSVACHWTSWYDHSQLWLLISITRNVFKIMTPAQPKQNLSQFRVGIESSLPLKMEKRSCILKQFESFKGTLHQHAINRMTLKCHIN